MKGILGKRHARTTGTAALWAPSKVAEDQAAEVSRPGALNKGEKGRLVKPEILAPRGIFQNL